MKTLQGQQNFKFTLSHNKIENKNRIKKQDQNIKIKIKTITLDTKAY